MRLIVTWDGSGHGLGALRDLVPLFQKGSIDHIEILLTIWPPRDSALWADIYDRQFVSDDLHRAAAEVAMDAAARLREVISPLSVSIASSSQSGARAEVVLRAITDSRADAMLVVIGNHDPSGSIRQTVEEVMNASSVPTWIVRAPGIIATTQK